MLKRFIKPRKFTLFLIICFAVARSGFAQQLMGDIQEDIKRAVPASPEAASLGKYGEIPVDMHSGIPEISIPLYELKGQELSLPISLSYHGGGFKVEEVASSVGLGWVLNAGGVISRAVRSWPDEASVVGYYDLSYTYHKKIEGTPTHYTDKYLFSCVKRVEMALGEVDQEPDDVYFNFNGYSGRITFNEHKEAIFYPYRNLKLEGSLADDYWIITTPDGTKYHFGTSEAASVAAIETSVFRYGNNYTSAWYLTAIESVKTNELITFKYEYNGENWKDNLTEDREFTRYLPLKHDPYDPLTQHGPPTQRICFKELKEQEIESTSTLRLRQINFSKQGIAVSLKYANDREDIQDTQSLPRLTRLDVLVNGDTLRSFDFKHDYFQGKQDGYAAYAAKRLKLLSLENRINHTKYTFDYETTHRLPAYKSPRIDHWGYYNNANNVQSYGSSNGVIIPQPPDLLSFTATYHVGSNDPYANRETNPEAVKACMLKKITYPTGGFTEFDWEANSVSYENVATIVHKNPSITCYSGTLTIMDVQEQALANYINSYPDDANLPINLKAEQFNVNKNGGLYCDIMVNKSANIDGYMKAFIYKASDEPAPENGGPLTPTLFLPDNLDPIHNLHIPGYMDISSMTNQTTRHLDRGAYFLIVMISKDIPLNKVESISAYINFEDQITVPYLNKYAGGVRIKEIRSCDGLNPANDVVKTYSYKKDYLEPLESQSYSRSSGKLFIDPYYSNYNYYYKHQCTENMVLTSFLVDYYGFPSREKGSHIGYAEVTEETKGLQGGFKTMLYDNSDEEERRSLLIAEKIYDSQLNPVKITSNTYTSYAMQATYTFYRVVLLRSLYICNKISCVYDINFRDLPYAGLPIYWPGLIKTNIKTYDPQDTNRFTEETIEYEYTGVTGVKHIIPAEKSFTGSDGSVRIEKIRYPNDFTNPNSIISSMKTMHCVHLPIEEQIYKDSKLTAAHYALYGNLGLPGMIALKELYEWDFAKQQSYVNGIDNATGSLVSNTSYRKILSLERENATGNLLTQTPTAQPPVAYLWGYKNAKPVIKIENLTYGEIPNPVKTTVSGYLFSAGNTLNKIQQDIAFLTAQIDRISQDLPTKQFMATLYTYNWMGNLASMTDPAGVTVYYEYDEYGRLKFAKDHLGNILQHYEYKYGGQ